MENTNLQTALEKRSLPELDVNYYMERIISFPQNEWFYPTNRDNEDYSICAHLYEMNLAQRVSIPNWYDGCFRGVSLAFKINLDLNYTKL